MPAPQSPQMLSQPSAVSQDAKDWLPLRPQTAAQNDLHDHQAKVFEIKGNARILQKGKDSWIPLQKEMILQAGDQIVTSEKSEVRIAYDSRFFNIAVIKEKTKAEFRSIEPTDLHLEDGSIFSAVDKLDGDFYQISTPTAVAAVRGTDYKTTYNGETGAFGVSLFPDGGDASHVFVTDLNQGEQGGTVELEEGQKLEAENDNTLLNQEMVGDLSNEEIGNYQNEVEALPDPQGLEDSLSGTAEAGTGLDFTEGLAEDGAGVTEDSSSLDQTVDETFETELSGDDLLGNALPETGSSEAAETESHSGEAPENQDPVNQTENISEQPAEEDSYSGEMVPEFENETYYENTVSLQDQITSEEAAQNEETSNEETGEEETGSESEH